nr:phage tail tape measure protein [uncultured Mediterranean phage uvMED]
MTQYGVDILLKIAGQQELKNLQTKLGAAEKAAEGLNKNLRALNKFDVSGATKRVNIEQKLLNLTRERLKLQRQFNESTSEGNRRARQAAADFIRRQRIYRQGTAQYAGPIGPGAASPLPESSPVALSTQLRGRLNRQLKEAADLQAHLGRMENRSLETNKRLLNNQKLQRQELGKIVDEKVKGIQADKKAANRAAENARKRIGDRAGAAVSAGAFPLLFGGGPGMALGGALGGAISGKTFGPAAIALQVLGGALDQFAATAAATGQALNPLTADVNAVAEAAGYANSPFGDLLVALENNGDAAEALRLATELMAVTVGTDGADALRDFGADTVELSTEFRKAMAVMQAALASFISKTGILQGISGGIERFTLRGQIRGTLKAGGENAKRLQETLGPVSFDTGEREFTAATYDLMRKINEEKEKGLKLEAENASLLSSVGIIATNNKKIAELDANLTNQRVYTLEKSNIMQEAILEKTKEGANAKLIDLERDAKLLDLQNRRNDQIESANQKTERERQRANRALEKAEKARMRELQDRIDIAERQREKELRLEKSYTRQIDRIGNQNALLRARLDGKEEEVKKEQLIAELVEKYGKDKRAAVELLVNEQFVLEKQVKAAEEMKAVYESIGNTIQTGVVNAITAAVEGTKTLGEVASNVLRSIANQLLRLGVNQLFGSFGFGGGGGGGSTGPNVDLVGQYMGERALGGPVGAGRPYMVGERGPELFVPGAQGNIVPNNAMGGANVTVNVDASGSSVEGNSDQASQLGKAIGIAVQQELVKQKRPGGLLAS